MTVKWKNADLYNKIVNGGPANVAWAAKPYVANFSVKALSSSLIPGTTVPYELDITAQNIMMTMVGGIQLAGNAAVMMRFQGVAIEGSGDYTVFSLLNNVTDYSWPT